MVDTIREPGVHHPAGVDILCWRGYNVDNAGYKPGKRKIRRSEKKDVKYEK